MLRTLTVRMPPSRPSRNAGAGNIGRARPPRTPRGGGLREDQHADAQDLGDPPVVDRGFYYRVVHFQTQRGHAVADDERGVGRPVAPYEKGEIAGGDGDLRIDTG